MSRKPKLIFAAAVVMILLAIGIRNIFFSGDETVQTERTPSETHDTGDRHSDGHIPEGWVPEGKERPTPPGQKRVAECQDGQCQGDEAIDFNLNPVVVEQWKPVAVQFANNFGAIEGRSSEEWLDSLHPFTIPSLFSKMSSIDTTRLRSGSRPFIIATDLTQFQEVSVRVDYPEGWTIYLKLQMMGAQDWKVITYDTPR